MWQALRKELHPLGIEIVTVGLEVLGTEACRPFIEAAAPEHPSLVDVDHVMASLFGVINIPNGVWINEEGVIVRPAEPASLPSRQPRGTTVPDGLPQRMTDIMTEAMKIKFDPNAYEIALRDWVKNGASSEYVLSPDEVVARSGKRDPSVAGAAAHFSLAQHLWNAGDKDAAITHFREAHRLQPENFSYKRQAWSLVPPPEAGPFARFWQGPGEGGQDEWPFESDWLSEIRAMGPENYYPTFTK